jgi:ketosteroid isomerase-like protein
MPLHSSSDRTKEPEPCLNPTTSKRSGSKRFLNLFPYHKPGTAFDIQELAVTASQDVAFAVAIMRCDPDSSSNPADKNGFPFRLTVGPRKIDGDWRIAHEHHSVPTTD